jgi:hypothetical protein
MVDYRRFLAATSEADLPYFGGPFVDATDRRLRLAGDTRPAPGFWRFEIRGRDARPIAPADPPDLSELPAVRGYAVADYLVHQHAERLALPPADQPLTFAPLVGRRWPTGALLFDTLDFEAGIEEEVRERYTAGQPLAELSGVPAALRAAYAYAVLLRASARDGVPARPAEARGSVAAIAAGGEPAARQVLRDLRREREQQPAAGQLSHDQPGAGQLSHDQPAAGQLSHDQPAASAPQTPARARLSAEDRADAALFAANAALRDTRWLANGVLEVRYDLDGERFVTLVDGQTMRVVDAGICLDGHDDRLTLDSLPGVIREAIRDHRLHITAW